MRKLLLTITALLLMFNYSFTQEQQDKMTWWNDAKFGMFIHWGVYSVPAGTYNGKQIDGIGEWIMLRGKIPVAEYKEFAKEFNPIKYNPDKWVKLAKEAGMKYIVITSKHHDGFGLFDSKVTDWDVVDATPYGKDLLRPLVEACHKYGIRIGFYYSQAQDWCHPGGAAAKGGHWDSIQNGSMDEYIEKIAVPQVEEILSNYGTIDILWWDTPYDMTKERAEKFLPTVAKYPSLITNTRLGGGYTGDLETPEQYVPATGYPGRNWETCMTMNDTWGYKSYDQNWKSSKKIIHTLIDIVSKGGNFLLNVGPTSEGLIPQPSIDRLKEVGKWTSVNGEAIYGTQASPFNYLPYGRATQKDNKIYLFVFDWPEDGKLILPLPNKVNKAYLLANPQTTFSITKSENKSIINLTGSPLDSIATVVVVDFEGKAEVLPIPSVNKKSAASSEKDDYVATNLFDNNSKNKWKPKEDDNEKWVEIDLGEETAIQAFAVIEPWHPWDNKKQKLALQYKKGGNWETAIEIETEGTGITQQIKPVKSQYFRIKILEAKDPTLCEWILYRDY